MAQMLSNFSAKPCRNNIRVRREPRAVEWAVRKSRKREENDGQIKNDFE